MFIISETLVANAIFFLNFIQLFWFFTQTFYSQFATKSQNLKDFYQRSPRICLFKALRGQSASRQAVKHTTMCIFLTTVYTRCAWTEPWIGPMTSSTGLWRHWLGCKFFIFQQDSAPAHCAYDTVEMLRLNTPAFIPPTLWPPNSPDLNPVDYKIWGVLQNRVYRTRIRDVDHLKERLVEEWTQFDQKIIDGSINQWRKRLRACVSADGGHFEQTM